MALELELARLTSCVSSLRLGARDPAGAVQGGGAKHRRGPLVR